MRISLSTSLLVLTAICLSSCSQIAKPEAELSKLMVESIEVGGDWFLRNFDSEGFIHYGYDPEEKEFNKGNNRVRKMGALWSITELEKYTGKEHFDELSRHGHKYFKRFYETDPEGYMYMDVSGKRKLAYNAFLLLYLVNIDKIDDKDELLTKFADGILAQQQEDGSYKTYFYDDKNTGQDYYPGEANLGLMKLYAKTSDERYLEAVQKSFPYYRDHWRNNKTLAFIPWQTQAFYELYKYTEDEELAEFIFEMNDYLIATQQNEHTFSERKHFGAYSYQSPGISTASYLEGLIDAYSLAKMTKDSSRATSYKDSIIIASQYLLSLQIREDNPRGLKEIDSLTLGGFTQSADTLKIRLDNNQHALAAFMKIKEAGVL